MPSLSMFKQSLSLSVNAGKDVVIKQVVSIDANHVHLRKYDLGYNSQFHTCKRASGSKTPVSA